MKKHAICAILALAVTSICMNVIVESGMARLLHAKLQFARQYHQLDVMRQPTHYRIQLEQGESGENP